MADESVGDLVIEALAEANWRVQLALQVQYRIRCTCGNVLCAYVHTAVRKAPAMFTFDVHAPTRDLAIAAASVLVSTSMKVAYELVESHVEVIEAKKKAAPPTAGASSVSNP